MGGRCDQQMVLSIFKHRIPLLKASQKCKPFNPMPEINEKITSNDRLWSVLACLESMCPFEVWMIYISDKLLPVDKLITACSIMVVICNSEVWIHDCLLYIPLSIVENDDLVGSPFGFRLDDLGSSPSLCVILCFLVRLDCIKMGPPIECQHYGGKSWVILKTTQWHSNASM